MWDLERERVIKEILRHKGKRVLFQAPEGLKLEVEREIEEIRRYFKDRGMDDIELIIWGGSAFGACDICDREGKYLNVDLIIHYGHEELPYVISEIPVVYVPVYYKPDREHLMEIYRDIDRILGEYKDPVITTTVQFKKILSRYNPHLILGCRADIILDDDRDILYIGSGRFHPLMLAYKFRKEIPIYNPITREFSKIERDKVEGFIKKRLGVISKLHLNPPRKIGVILSTKRGQCRIGVFERVIKILKERGIKYIPIVLDNINPEDLIYNVDAYVVCACPRVVLDDYIKYKKILLTPKEFEMYINGNFDYQLDEILLEDF